LRGRERYRDWPSFLLIAASRQARIFAYMSREVADQLHQQVLAVEEAAGLALDDDEDEDEEEENGTDEVSEQDDSQQSERESNTFSPAFAQALERLNDLARQRLPEAGGSASQASDELADVGDASLGDEEAALEQLQEAFVQMMEVVRELAEELSTDALKLTSRFRCARTDVFFTQAMPDDEDEEDDEEDDETAQGLSGEEGSVVELELALVLRLFEEGRSKPDDLPVAELQLDVDDFERLHETLDFALERDRRSRRRRS
jgi:hypothetical protein